MSLFKGFLVSLGPINTINTTKLHLNFSCVFPLRVDGFAIAFV